MTLEFVPNLGSVISGATQPRSLADMGSRENRLRVAAGQVGAGASEATGAQRVRNEAGWKKYLADPRVKSGLMQFGANLLAGQGLGASAGGGIAAVGRAEDARIAAEDAARTADLEERALALRENAASGRVGGGGSGGSGGSGSGGVSGIGSDVNWLDAVTAEYQAAVDNDLTGATTMPPVEQLINEAEARKQRFIYGQKNPEYAAMLTEFPNLTVAQFEAAQAENAAANGGAASTGDQASTTTDQTSTSESSAAPTSLSPINIPSEVSSSVSSETQNALASLSAASNLDTTLPLTEQSAKINEALRSIETLDSAQARSVRANLRSQLSTIQTKIRQEAAQREAALAFNDRPVSSIQREQETQLRTKQTQLSRALEELALSIAVAGSTGDNAEVARLTQEFKARKKELDNITTTLGAPTDNSAIQPLLNTINVNN